MNQKRKSVHKMISCFSEIFTDVLCPKRCIKCNCLVPIGRKETLCDDCKKLVHKLFQVVVEPDSFFDEVICALPYEAFTRDAMLRYKFGGRRYLAKGFSKAVELAVEEFGFADEYSFICPVPTHRARDREYNQSYLIASELGVNAQVAENLLIKLKNIRPLSSMGYLMRRECIKGAIEFNLKYDIFGKNILLVDDIYTTGSTVNECARILKMHGASKVTVLAACYRKGDDGNFHADNLRDQELRS